MIKTREVMLQSKSVLVKEHLPTLLKWKGQNMMRIHSVRATVKEIVEVSKNLDVVKIGIIGNQHTGKSTLAKLLGHLIHKMSDIPFAIRIFDEDSLLNFEKTLRTLAPTNYVLIFDDVSFMKAHATQSQIEIVKQAVTKIRHLQGGKDVKIITIMNYHYTLGLDKYLRQADFRYFTSVGSSELDNMEKIVKSHNMRKVHSFQKMYTRAIVSKKFTYRIGKKGFFTYGYRAPFIPLLFYNEDSLRNVVAPTREWIDPICTICSSASAERTLDSFENIEQFKIEFNQKFGPGVAEAAIKIELLLNGMNVYSRSVVQARRYLERAFQVKLFNLEQLATTYGLTITKTKLQKKLDGILQ